MQLYWGDVHNHCGITYGKGSLTNALSNAMGHLDFCSVTPHAFWNDMPSRCKETAGIIDFHNEGFAKIQNGWKNYVKEMEKANQPGRFTTFFSFEMHSSHWGDYTFLSPDCCLEITKLDTPREVLEANRAKNARMMGIPHHIGYTPGYRGINWEGFDSQISPVVEVCSKHGNAMHDGALPTYYHDMGPLDPINTVYAGLERGYHFGFIGSTDHHAGYPGSYGDGKLALLAESNTREALWDALLHRRSYAVTGCKIECAFSVNEVTFGGFAPRNRADISFAVEAGGEIDRILIFRNLEPIQTIDGRTLPDTGDRFKIQLELGWGRNSEPFDWNVEININNGKILSAEPCFRGRNYLSPTQELDAGDEINRTNDYVNLIDSVRCCLHCATVKNDSSIPMTSSVILEITGDENTSLVFNINGIQRELKLNDLRICGTTGHMKPYHSNAYKIHTAVPHGKYSVQGSFSDVLPGDFYHMEVRQVNGDKAYISPVYLI